MSANPYESPETVGSRPQRKSSLLPLAFRVLAVVCILLLLAALLVPLHRGGAGEAARRMGCSNNLHNIAIALHNYESIYHCLPPAYTVDATGKPLHSWRTLILPFIEQKSLYDQIDLSKPWDDSANRAAYEASPKVYGCPSSNIPKGRTLYLAIVAPGGCFQPTEPRLLADITDDKNLTLMVAEIPEKHAVHWMEPSDVNDELLLVLKKTDKPHHPNGALAVSVDGHVRFLTRNTPPAVLRALISIAGNDDAVAQAED